MPLATLCDMLPAARREGRAVGAFNIASFETAKSVIAAAEAENQPVILQVYHRLMADPQIGALAAMMRYMAANARVPVAVHLDHGATLEQVRRAIDCGFSSVMFDGSQLSFDENVAMTREAAGLAHRKGVSIEGEIGRVPISGADGADRVIPASPSEAARFARESGIDALAVGIGTAHGYYRTAPVVRLDLARKIADATPIPLVLHGGSGTPPETVAEVIRAGFSKVNVSTEFQHGFQQQLDRTLRGQNGSFLPIDKLMQPATSAATEALRGWIRAFARPITLPSAGCRDK